MPPKAAHGKLDVRAAVERWPEAWQVEWHERAAIMEFDGGLERPKAEFYAYREILERPAFVAWLRQRAEQRQLSRKETP